MTPLENKKLIKGALEELSRGFIPTDEVLKTLIVKAFLAGEKSGKGKAVDYLKENWVVKENVAGTPPEFSYTYDEYTLDKARK